MSGQPQQLAQALALLLVTGAVLSWPQRLRSRRGRRDRVRAVGGVARVGGGGGGDATGGVRGAGPDEPPTPDVTAAVLMELVAACLDCGLAPQRAVAAAVEVSGTGTRRRLGPHVDIWHLGAEVARAWAGVGGEYEALSRSLVLAEQTGASASAVLRRVAGDERARRRRRARIGAHRLGVRLVVPLGLTTLPAFVLWAVVPVVIGLAEQMLGTST